MTANGTMNRWGRVGGRVGRAVAVGALAATLLVGAGGGQASARSSQEVACANMGATFDTLANQAMDAYANGDDATGDALRQQLAALLNRMTAMGC